MLRNPFAADWKYKWLTLNDDIFDNDPADIGSGWITACVAFSPRWKDELCRPPCSAITGSSTTSSVAIATVHGSPTTASIAGSSTTSSVPVQHRLRPEWDAWGNLQKWHRFPSVMIGPLRRTRTLCDQTQTQVWSESSVDEHNLYFARSAIG